MELNCKRSQNLCKSKSFIFLFNIYGRFVLWTEGKISLKWSFGLFKLHTYNQLNLMACCVIYKYAIFSFFRFCTFDDWLITSICLWRNFSAPEVLHLWWLIAYRAIDCTHCANHSSYCILITFLKVFLPWRVKISFFFSLSFGVKKNFLMKNPRTQYFPTCQNLLKRNAIMFTFLRQYCRLLLSKAITVKIWKYGPILQQKWPLLWTQCVQQAPDFGPCTVLLFGQVPLLPHLLRRGIMSWARIWK